jgi:hypothetical protein
MSSQNPISAGTVIQLAQDAMKSALEENQTKAAEASGVSNELKPGVTIDLSHKQIKAFPEEVVDIIKNELERYDLVSLALPSPSCRMQLTAFCHPDLPCRTTRSPHSLPDSRNAPHYGT